MAAARAEARRKAILSRGTDRLAKLTTSARGEEAPAYMHDDPPLPTIKPGLKNFVGEETRKPTLRHNSQRNPSPADSGGGHPQDPSVLSEDLQRRYLTAVMNGPALVPSAPGASFRAMASSNNSDAESMHSREDPFAALMSKIGAQHPPNASGKTPAADSIQSPSRLQRLVPLVHLITVWCLLVYFVLWREPEVFEEQTHGAVINDGRWRRWAELGWRNTMKEGRWGVQLVPFFWGFVTLQIILHSFRIFLGFDTVRTPTLLDLVLPHLPSPFPSLIDSALRYLQMGGLFLNDLAGLIFGVGFIVLVAGWIDG